MRFVIVKFLSSRDSSLAGGFIYKDELPRKLNKYDTVIVPTRYGLSMAVVTRTCKDEEEAQKAYVGTFGLHEIKSVAEKIKSKVVEEQNKIQKAKDLKKQLEKVMKEVDETQKYKMYAEISPEVATLLKELETLKA